MGWAKYIGQDGLFCGIPDDSFGLSGPAKEVYNYFGVTTEKITEKIWVVGFIWLMQRLSATYLTIRSC